MDKLTIRALQGRLEGIYWDILQTNTAAEVVFNRQWKLLQDSGLLLGKPNESEKFITVLNQAKIFYKSGEVLEDLRAETLDGCIIDEMRQQHEELWPRIIRPMLSRRKAWCDIYSTPNGYDHFYDLWERAKFSPDEWSIFHAPSTECWWWTDEEIESAKKDMSEAEFAQEILAEFRDLHTGKTYINSGAHNWRTDNPFAERGREWCIPLPIVVGMDFNVNPMAWCLGQNKGTDWHWGDELYIRNTNTQECAKALVEKVRGHRAGVTLVGDASGNARKTSASGTDLTIVMEALRNANIPCTNQTPDSNPHVKDRVNIMNGKCRAADGSVHMWVNPIKCPMLKRDLERVSWKQGTQVILDQSTNPDLTHMSDAAGYPICALNPLQQTGSVGVMRILR